MPNNSENNNKNRKFLIHDANSMARNQQQKRKRHSTKDNSFTIYTQQNFQQRKKPTLQSTYAYVVDFYNDPNHNAATGSSSDKPGSTTSNSQQMQHQASAQQYKSQITTPNSPAFFQVNPHGAIPSQSTSSASNSASQASLEITHSDSNNNNILHCLISDQSFTDAQVINKFKNLLDHHGNSLTPLLNQANNIYLTPLDLAILSRQSHFLLDIVQSMPNPDDTAWLLKTKLKGNTTVLHILTAAMSVNEDSLMEYYRHCIITAPQSFTHCMEVRDNDNNLVFTIAAAFRSKKFCHEILAIYTDYLGLWRLARQLEQEAWLNQNNLYRSLTRNQNTPAIMRELNKNIPPFLYGSRLTGERLASSNSNEAFCLHSDEGPIEIPSWLTVKDGQNTLHIYFSDLSLSENVLSQLIDNYFHMDKSTFAACLEKTDDNGHTVLISIIKYRSNLLLNKLLDIYKNDLGMWRFIRIMETTDDLREIGLSLTKARTPDILILRRLKNIVPFSLLKDNVLFENLQNHSLHSLKSTVSLLGDTIYLASAVEALYFFDGLLKSSEETQNKFIIPAAINYLQLSNTDEGHIREALVNLLTYGKSREQYIQSLASSMALNQNAEEAYLIHNFLKYYLINNIELFNAIEDRYLQQIEQHEPPAPGC